jgi:putative CocE/NonD family hydrolase
MDARILAVAVTLMGLGAAPARAAVLGEPSGTGPWPAVAESRAELPGHTVYHPAAYPRGPLPLLVWGNGGCRDNGQRYAGFLREIASQGYIVVAVGVPRGEQTADAPPPPAVPQGPGTVAAAADETQPAQLLEAIDWATRETARAGGPFEGRIDVAKVAVAGHSCGGLQALAVSQDPRVDTTLVLNSGVYNPGSSGRSGVRVMKEALQALHAPLLYLTGGPRDIAHVNAVDDVARIGHLPVFLGALPVGHGGTYFADANGGDYAQVVRRWLDWRLKGDADASWDFAGPACRLCNDGRWSVQQKNLGLPEGPYRESRYVPVRDGTRLAVHVWRGAVEGRPVPADQAVLFAFTPYRARYRRPDGTLEEFDLFTRYGLKPLLQQGYALAMADVRGKGASFGARRGFQDRTEAQDGHELIQWLAAQPWSSGKVGMLGCSYLGGSTMQVATTAPPALKAIFSAASDLDKYHFVRRGGITAQFNTRPDEPLSDDLMSLPVDEDPQGLLLRQAVAQHAGNTPMAALWYGMPYRDSVSPLTGNRFWEEVGPYTHLEALRKAGIPTYFWSNWQDEPTEQVILAAANLGGKLLVGPGTHCVPPPGFDLGGELKRYFDHHLKGRDSGLYAEPRHQWIVEGAPPSQAWQRSDALPGARATRQRWLLTREGGLTPAGSTPRGERAFTVDYAVGDGAYFPFWVDSQADHGLAFTSEALPDATLLEGFALLDLQVAVDREDANLFGYLEAVAPDGKAQVLSFGRLAASHRKEVPPPYDTLGMPWHSGRQADVAPMRPGRFERLRFNFTPTSRVVPAGHRLRVVVTGADPRQRNLAQIRQDPPPRITLAVGGRRGSVIELPVVRLDGTPPRP